MEVKMLGLLCALQRNSARPSLLCRCYRARDAACPVFEVAGGCIWGAGCESRSLASPATRRTTPASCRT